MVFEDFQPGRAEATNTDINTKLFECAYPGTRNESQKNYCAAANDKQSPERERAPEAPKEKTETREQAIDNKIKDRFGADVLEHLKDWDWLVENRKKLEDGFKKAKGDDAWDMAKRMKELSVVDGKPLIYLSKQDGPTHGNLVPKRYDIYLRRGRFRSDDHIGQLNH